MIKKTFTSALFSMLAAATLFTACKKEPGTIPEYTFVSMYNASPSSATYNIYFDTERLINGALPFDGNISYKQINPKSYTLKLTSESSTESKLSKQLNFAADRGYSLFIIGKEGKTGVNDVDRFDILQIEDELKAPGTDKALIRFINLSPDAPALSLHEKDKDAIISDKAYKSASAFIEVDARKYIFDLKDKATNLSKGVMAEVDLKKGGIYTLVAKGLLTPATGEKAFGGSLIAN